MDVYVQVGKKYMTRKKKKKTKKDKKTQGGGKKEMTGKPKGIENSCLNYFLYKDLSLTDLKFESEKIANLRSFCEFKAKPKTRGEAAAGPCPPLVGHLRSLNLASCGRRAFGTKWRDM